MANILHNHLNLLRTLKGISFVLSTSISRLDPLFKLFAYVLFLWICIRQGTEAFVLGHTAAFIIVIADITRLLNFILKVQGTKNEFICTLITTRRLSFIFIFLNNY